ncbi:MAG: OmpH family outer membrane protein [Acidobacteria bacterium]|nr:OmpH family outer membrane protein [Acidobacteriota bacterium]
MRNQATVIGVAIFGLVVLAVAAGPLGAAPQRSGGIAFVDNARVFDESNPGKAATQQIQANVNTWQQQLTTIETELQGLMSQRQQQSAIMTPGALRNLDADIEQKQIDLQRLRDDAQRQATATQNRVLADLDATLTPVVGALASELGYDVVLNSETPGLLYFNPAVDITDQLIARLNAMDQ